MSNQQIAQRETNVTQALQLESINNQLNGLLKSNPQKIEAFKTKMLKMSINPMLMGCSPESVINCGLQALTLDLPLEAGQGYIVKYGKGSNAQAQLDIGYKGWQVLAKRSGFSVMADAVYNCDMFEPAGYGFEAKLNFEPNHGARQSANDQWVKDNLRGVIVSIREDATGLITPKFVPADLIFKIVGMSPSVQSENGKKYSPHKNWAEQMLCAKAIKHVISKVPVDLSKAATLNDAVQIVNSTESQAQTEPSGLPAYSQSRFDENWPKWVKLVENGRQKAVTIITQLSNGFALTETQVQAVMSLTEYEPIEGDVTEAPQPAQEQQPAQQQPADGVQANPAAASDNAAKKTYTDDQFRDVYAMWRDLVEAGKRTPTELLTNIQTNYQLTDAQVQSIEGLHDCVPVQQEAS